MFVSSLTSDSDYFLVDKSFAALKYTGTSIIYTFTLYGRLLQALIDGNDEIKIQIVRKTTPKLKYFYDSTMEGVEASNLGFVQNVKNQLSVALRDGMISEKSIELINVLSDDIVTGVGNGTINETNYRSFLPNIEQVTISNSTSRRRTINNDDVYNFPKLTLKLFNDTGIYPGKVANVNFPGRKLSADNDGVEQGMNSAETKKLLENNMFRDYYTNYYVKNTNSRIRQRFTNSRAEFQKFTVDIEMPIDDDGQNPLDTLPAYKDLSLRTVILKDDIEVSSNLFTFDNAILFEEATAGARKIESSISVPQPIDVRPDRVTVTNKESYPVEVSVFEYILIDRAIRKSTLEIATLNENESIDVDGSLIYFDQSESRAYAVTANRAIPGVQGVSNVVKILSPPSTNVAPKTNESFSINVVPNSSPTEAKIQVSGLSSPDQSALIYKRKVGESERILMGRVRYGASSIVDRSLSLNDVVIYTGELQVNGAGANAKSMSGFVCSPLGDTGRLSFSITDKRTLGSTSRPVHSFKIVENVSTTTAEKLLQMANESGESGVYFEEIDAEKQDSTVVTQYLVVRIKKVECTWQLLSIAEAGKPLRFPLENAEYDSPDEKYEYLVLPFASSLAALSYATVVQATDVATGNEYKFRYKKWRDKNFERSEILPSTSTVLENDLSRLFIDLPPGVGETCTFTRKTNNGRVLSLKAVSKQNLDCAFLSWRYTGDINTVLHFIVMANYNGTKAPIGLSIPDKVESSQTLITYCDDVLGSVSGEVVYSVVPVFVTGHQGDESSGSKVTSTKNYPRRALRKVT